MLTITSLVLTAVLAFPTSGRLHHQVQRGHHHPGTAVHCPPGWYENDLGWLVWGGDAECLEFATIRWPAPEVSLSFDDQCDPGLSATFRLSSTDQPPHWTPIPISPMRIEVIPPGGLPMDFVELRLNGEPLPFNSAEGYVHELHCPRPGRHLLQARYLSGNRWSTHSRPVRFEVQLPVRPQIVAMVESCGKLVPIQPTGLTAVRSSNITLRLAHVAKDAEVVAYLNGRPVEGCSVSKDCCVTIPLVGQVPTGVHQLVVRTVACPGTCRVTSDPSDEVFLHYYDEEVYLLRPQGGCDDPEPCEKRTKSPNPKYGCCGEKWMGATAPSSKRSDAAAGQLPEPLVAEPMPLSPLHRRVLELEESVREAERDHALRQRLEKARERLKELLPNDASSETDDQGDLDEDMEVPAEPPAAPPSAPVPPRQDEQPTKGDRESRTFYFASAAHFPLREFGLQGEVLDHDGLVVYEDMQFAVAHNGDYRVTFRSSHPRMPVTLRLQFQIRAGGEGAAWHTVTLSPIRIDPTQSGSAFGTSCAREVWTCDGEGCCEGARPCVCTGNSEILRRCFDQLGEETVIRRVGTARFGYGYASHRQ